MARKKPRPGSTSAPATCPSRWGGKSEASIGGWASLRVATRMYTCVAEDAENLDMDMMQTLQADRKVRWHFVPFPERIRGSLGRSWNCRRGALLRVGFLLMT